MNMRNDLKPDGLTEWTQKIQSTAKKICKDDNDRIEFKIIPQTNKISIKVADIEALDCLRQSIQLYLKSSSLGVKTILTTILKDLFPQLEKQLNEK